LQAEPSRLRRRGVPIWDTQLSEDRRHDLPVGTIQRDETRGTLYIGTDFGVAKRVGPATGWMPAMPGLPTTTVPYLKIDQANRVMYVTTHGFGAWALKLP